MVSLIPLTKEGMKMDLRRLDVFCKVYELKSFSRAAEASLLSQPTVSEHIRYLEDLLEVRLFDRLGREVAATRAGELLYGYARRILSLTQEASRSLELYRGKVTGTLELGGSTIPGQYVLPILIGSFKRRHKDIRIRLVIADTREVTDMVLDGTLELGVVGARFKNSKLAFDTLFEDELVLAVPPDHPWASRRAIRLDELAEASFIMREPGSGTRMTTLSRFEEAGFDPENLRIMAEMGSTDAVRQAVKAKVGVSILSRRAIADDVRFGLLSLVSIENLSLTRHFYLVIHKGRSLSPLAQAFVEFLKKNHAGLP
jgi:DNA-binding transcriptional LysR family regulator